MIGFIYPSDPFNPRQVDEAYVEEASKFKQLGFDVYHADVFDNSTKSINLGECEKVFYRGWMLDEQQYRQLAQRCGERLMVCPQMYLLSHHLPQWYCLVQDLTVETVWCNEENLLQTYDEFSNGHAVFIKDYVKSLKTGDGSTVHDKEQLLHTIAQMKHFRTTIEGGIVLRRHHEFNPQSERRFFVLNDEIFSPLHVEPRQQLVVQQVKQRIGDRQLFYSVDVIDDLQGKSWLVEIGDGQVSDLVGWDCDSFSHVFDRYRVANKPRMK